jgi:hypothetical protein
LTLQRGYLDADQVRRRVETLIPPRPTEVPDFQILRAIGNRRYPKPNATTYAIGTEANVRAVVLRLNDTPFYSRLPMGPGRVVLFVSHQSGDHELRVEPLVKQLIEDEPQSEFYMMDARGTGDSQPQTCGENQFLLPYGSDYFYAAHSIMLGLPYPVQRAFDILRVIQWIKSFKRTEIHLAALGWGTIPATLAAVVSDDVQQVTLKHALTSFAEIAEAEHYDWPLSAFIPSVLASFDLPDCYRALESKQLQQIDPRKARS